YLPSLESLSIHWITGIHYPFSSSYVGSGLCRDRSGSESHHTTPNATEAFPTLMITFIRSVQPVRTAFTTRMIPGVCPAWSVLGYARRVGFAKSVERALPSMT
nr:hypothetical protein [Tanacetum cinerariifolium]